MLVIRMQALSMAAVPHAVRLAGPDGALSSVQEAFRTHHGLQCGFCTPGMIMSATALLRENPRPTVAEVRDYLEGNICRCTGYHNIVRAVMAAAE